MSGIINSNEINGLGQKAWNRNFQSLNGVWKIKSSLPERTFRKRPNRCSYKKRDHQRVAEVGDPRRAQLYEHGGGAEGQDPLMK